MGIMLCELSKAKKIQISDTRQRQVFSLICGMLKNKITTRKNKLTNTENRSVVARGRGWVIGKMGERESKGANLEL